MTERMNRVQYAPLCTRGEIIAGLYNHAGNDVRLINELITKRQLDVDRFNA